MKGLRKLLLEEQQNMESIRKDIQVRLSGAPEGSLRLSKSHNHVQYYWCRGEKKSGDYISKENIALAGKLAQKAYDEKVLRLAERYLR